jgi:hypothetical protein
MHFIDKEVIASTSTMMQHCFAMYSSARIKKKSENQFVVMQEFISACLRYGNNHINSK